MRSSRSFGRDVCVTEATTALLAVYAVMLFDGCSTGRAAHVDDPAAFAAAPDRLHGLATAEEARHAVDRHCCSNAASVVSAIGAIANPPTRWIDAHKLGQCRVERADLCFIVERDPGRMNLRVCAPRQMRGQLGLHHR